MKVICINNSTQEKFLVTAETYTVASETSTGFYVLVEIPINKYTGDVAGFLKERFIPLSDIDETELIKEREDSKVGFS